jgi:hypothetical protein
MVAPDPAPNSKHPLLHKAGRSPEDLKLSVDFKFNPDISSALIFFTYSIFYPQPAECISKGGY